MELSITIRYDNGIKRGITLARSEADEHNIESNFDFGYDVRQALDYLDVPCYDPAKKVVPPTGYNVLPPSVSQNLYRQDELDEAVSKGVEAARAQWIAELRNAVCAAYTDGYDHRDRNFMPDQNRYVHGRPFLDVQGLRQLPPMPPLPTMFSQQEVDAMIAEALEADRAKRPRFIGQVEVPDGARYGDFMNVDGFPEQSIPVPPMDHQFLRIAGYASKSIRYGLVGGATTDVPVFMPTVDFTGDLIDCPEDFVPVIVTVLR